MTWRDWIRTVEIAPVLGRAGSPVLTDQIEALLRTGCRIFHVDVGEHLNELVAVRLVSPIVHRYDGALDVQMTAPAGTEVLASLADAGADSVTFAVEEVADVPAAITAVRDVGLQVGLTYAPSTDPERVAALCDGVGLVRCPDGQLDDQLRGVRLLARALPADVAIEVGGGITHDNVRELYDAGARVLLVGRAIFEREDLPRAYRRLVQALA